MVRVDQFGEPATREVARDESLRLEDTLDEVRLLQDLRDVVVYLVENGGRGSLWRGEAEPYVDRIVLNGLTDSRQVRSIWKALLRSRSDDTELAFLLEASNTE